MTVREVIEASMRKIGVLASGETPSNEETSDGLEALNLMLSSFSNESLMIHAKVREEFSLASGQSSRTIGSSGNFNTTRPVGIDRAGVEDSSGYETPIKILNQDEWAMITDKALTAERPSAIYYEPTSPLGTIYFWPVPSASSSLVLYHWRPLTTFTSLSTSVEFPPGYDEMLIYNLAVRIAPEFGKSVSAEVAEVARESKAQIKRMNTKPVYAESDFPISRGDAYWIYSGD